MNCRVLPLQAAAQTAAVKAEVASAAADVLELDKASLTVCDVAAEAELMELFAAVRQSALEMTAAPQGPCYQAPKLNCEFSHYFTEFRRGLELRRGTALISCSEPSASAPAASPSPAAGCSCTGTRAAGTGVERGGADCNRVGREVLLPPHTSAFT